MARPASWLPRLHEISRSVGNSQRSHYGRRDLELLFKIKPRAAGNLLEMIATNPVGTSHLVERGMLAGFLDSVREAEDVPALFERIRRDKANMSRVRARYMVMRDVAEVPLAALPASLTIQPGQVTIRFERIEELVQQLITLGQVMQDDPVGFQRRCEGERIMEETPEALDARYIANQIEQMRAAS